MIKVIEENLSGNEYMLTAEYNGQYAGKLVYDLFVFDSHSANISDLEVDAKLRRKGIATELLNSAIEQIFKRPFMKNIFIQDGSDKGITTKLAQKFGFKIFRKEYPVWLKLNK